jgi:alkaline phosphatase
VQAFDEAIGKAIEFYRKHPDETLIIVTADHETGGMALGHRETRYDSNLELLKYQKSSESEMLRIANDFRKNKSSDTIAEFNRMLKVMENELGLNSRMHETQLDSTETAVLLGYFKAGIYLAGDEKEIYGDSNPLISEAVMIMNKRAGISWGTGSHSGIDVPVYATGTGADEFSGSIDNTDIPGIIERLMGLGK